MIIVGNATPVVGVTPEELDAAIERISANESDIDDLTASFESFVPITSEEVNALFE